MEEIQKMIQSETDKVRNEYSKKLKMFEDENTELKKQKMTEDEKKAFEAQEYEKKLQAKEAELAGKEARLKAIDLLTEAKIPLSFAEFVG